ncbi:sugar phosphate isomerase/epimerase family protein [Paenibacillus cellulosilyticus]|uniref:sugar phosphate isomerase/epimerase family protein n=1 Tax=Paenibacillus cellulosilyticus TaxID=375489 RepID=UPI001FEE93D7|nr:TIM barrel protein [Paenibacillus cellulosilyticus]
MRHQPITKHTSTLDIHMSWWGMSNLLFDGRELTMEEQFRLIADSGFQGIDAFTPEPGESAEQWRALLEQYGLALSVNVYPTSLDDMKAALDRAAAYGSIKAVNVQVMTPFVIGEAAVTLLSGIASLADEYKLPINIETHRGTITQDLIRTAEYVERIPNLRLTADLSHYVLAGEMLNVPEQAEAYFQLLLSRADCIHARLSNGEQIQVDIGTDGSHPMLDRYGQWWKDGMRSWRQSHPEGGSLLFIPELGPPPYAITIDEPSSRKREISDRWEQSLTLMRYARSLWDSIE